MPLQQNMISLVKPDNISGPNDIADIVVDLNHALDRLDKLGLTDAGAMLARVLDSLASSVSDASESSPATQS